MKTTTKTATKKTALVRDSNGRFAAKKTTAKKPTALKSTRQTRRASAVAAAKATKNPSRRETATITNRRAAAKPSTSTRRPAAVKDHRVSAKEAGLGLEQFVRVTQRHMPRVSQLVRNPVSKRALESVTVSREPIVSKQQWMAIGAIANLATAVFFLIFGWFLGSS